MFALLGYAAALGRALARSPAVPLGRARCWAALPRRAAPALPLAAGPALGRARGWAESSRGPRNMFRFLYFLRIEMLSYFNYESNFDKS